MKHRFLNLRLLAVLLVLVVFALFLIIKDFATIGMKKLGMGGQCEDYRSPDALRENPHRELFISCGGFLE